MCVCNMCVCARARACVCDQHSLLNQLTGKELTKLHKSLGKPSFQGKKKEKQVLTVIKTLKNEDV